MQAAIETLIAYSSFSTSEQGRAGLGIEAQRQTVIRFPNAAGVIVPAEYVEIKTRKEFRRK